MNPIKSGLVSTIIPVYNRHIMVRKAVDSVVAQSYRPIEIILIDDGSIDETPAVLDRLACEHPTIIRVIHTENHGPGPARETGRLAARGEYIQYLDSDDWLLPDKFSIQVKALQDNPDCGIAYGQARLVNSQGKVLKEPSKWTGKRFDYLFPALLVDRWWHTHTPLFRRAVSDVAGAWPSRRPEDWDLEARMGALKVRLIFCDAVLSCQQDHPDPNRVSKGTHDSYLRDEAWFLPRLYACAIKAGVNENTPEMAHFSRWAFMRARHLGALGEEGMAQSLYELARESSGNIRLSMRFVGYCAKVLGWKTTGKLCSLREQFPVSNHFSEAGR